MPPPTLAQDRLARAQHPNSAAQSAASPGRGGRARLSTSSSTFSGFGPRAGSLPASAPVRREREGSATTTGSGRGGRGGRDDVAGYETPLTGEERKAVENNEMWEDRQRKHKAAMILGNWELLAWYAVAGHERMMIGLPDAASGDEWEDEKNPGEDDSGPRRGSSSGSGGMKKKH
ncbi:MAG: hypothetical protein Q9191_000338 [Dirinaria sp. TL-2023a]